MFYIKYNVVLLSLCIEIHSFSVETLYNFDIRKYLCAYNFYSSDMFFFIKLINILAYLFHFMQQYVYNYRYFTQKEIFTFTHHRVFISYQISSVQHKIFTICIINVYVKKIQRSRPSFESFIRACAAQTAKSRSLSITEI